MDNIGKLSTEPHPSTNLNLPRCIFLLPSRSWPDVGVASVASAAGSTSCKSSPRKLKTWLLGISTISATSSGAMPRSNMPRWRTNAGNTWEPPFVIGFPCATTDKNHATLGPLWPTMSSWSREGRLSQGPGVEARSMSRALPSSMTCRSGKRWTVHAFNSSRPT